MRDGAIGGRSVRLLYAIEDRYPPFRADVVELFAHELPRRGFQIDWMMRRGPQAMHEPTRITWNGQHVWLSPATARRGLPGRVANAMLGAWGDLRMLGRAWRGRYDVIQVRDRAVLGLWAWVVSRLTGARFVFWMSYPYAESKLDQARQGFVPRPTLTRFKGRFIGWVLYRLVLPRADHVFVQSQRMKDDVARQGVDPGRMTPVPMGIRADQVGQPSDARAPDPVQPLLLYLGIILRLRQTEMLVDVLHRVRRRYPGARLRYVGEGLHASDRKAIEDAAERLGLRDAVEITGFLPMEQAWQHVKEADVCFSPFQPIPVLQSTSPTKLVEYMAMAKCIVANHHPEQTPMMVASGVGRTVDWDAGAFAEAVCALLDDPAAAAQAASRGPAYVRKHRTYAVIGHQVEAQYRKLLAR